jgi:hypothetical protein
LISQNDVNKILDEINDEFYHKIHDTKTELIHKAAEKLESLDIPKRTIAAELVEHLRFASKAFIYRVLGPEYKRESEDLSTSRLDDEKKVLEQEAKHLREVQGIPEGAEVLESDDPVVRKVLEKLKIVTEERNYYRSEFDKYKGMYEALREGKKPTNQFIIHPDTYDEIFELAKKSPNGILLLHDGVNVFNWKPLAVKKPTNPGEKKEISI